jgi:hypothetical protein
MPNCFQLTRIGERTPARLQDVDRAICQNLELPFDEDKWVLGWYHIIGLACALGKSLPEIMDMLGPEDRLWPVAAWLAANYTTDAWYQHGWR